MTAQMYDQVDGKPNAAHDPRDGLLFRIAGLRPFIWRICSRRIANLPDAGGSPMAVGLIIEIPEMTAAMYDEVNGRANAPDDPPDGLLFHMAGPSDGGWRIVDAWESRAAFDRFAAEKLGPILNELTGGQVPPPQPVEFNVHSIEFHNANVG